MALLPLLQPPPQPAAAGCRQLLHDLHSVHTAGRRHWHEIDDLADTAPTRSNSSPQTAVTITGWQRLTTMLLALITTILAGVDAHLLVFGLVPLTVIVVVSVIRYARSRADRTSVQAARS